MYSKSDCYALYRLVDENKEFPYRDELSGFEIRELRNRVVSQFRRKVYIIHISIGNVKGLAKWEK